LDIAARVADFYETHPYPPPVDDLDAYRRHWDDARRRAESHLFWPHESVRDDRSVLVAGCGTSQAAHYAARWPNARVTGIDVSSNSIAFGEGLKRKHALDNLELRQLPVERAGELGRTFDHVVCTGVLHHLADPDSGLRALRAVLAPSGALHAMVYAPYGRAGIYILQDYCRRLGIGASGAEIDALAATLRALPADHPIVPLLRNSPDFSSAAGLADALLHPNDRAYSVPQFLGFLEDAGLHFGRWLRQAPYSPWCGAIASTPHGPALRELPPRDRYAALELFRGAMLRHSAVAYATESAAQAAAIDFDGPDWLAYVPVRQPDTVEVRERLPAGAAAVLINRNHTSNDLYLPVDDRQLELLREVDGERSLAEICGVGNDRERTREFFVQLWLWDQVVFDTSRAKG
jgi:SAM-dependent methyltransferase